MKHHDAASNTAAIRWQHQAMSIYLQDSWKWVCLKTVLDPETSLTTDSQLRAKGERNKEWKEPALIGLCNSLFTYANCSTLPKLSSGNVGFPVPLAKYSVIVNDNALSIKTG